MFKYSDFISYLKKHKIYEKLISFLDDEYQKHTVFPSKNSIFNAFKLIDKKDIKVAIIGQDPYIHLGEANGLAFSVYKGVKLPPSLKNIYKEIEYEFSEKMDYSSGDLSYLASQGVLLINSILTVRENESLSHDNILYKELFNLILNYLNEIGNHMVFLLFGNYAKKYKDKITNKNRLIIETSHPSPLGANKGGFFYSNCFLKANKYLKEHNIKEINWINK